MSTTLIVIFIFSFLAFSISAICGGGAGLMLIPLLGRLLPVVQVPAALSIGTFTGSASRLMVFYQHISWKIVKRFVPWALPAVWLGAWLLKYINPLFIEIAMGLFLISNLHFVFKKPKVIETDVQPSNLTLSIIGFFAGFLSGLTGAVGLLFNRFYLRYGLSKEEILATRAANEIILHLIKIVLYTLFGMLNRDVWLTGMVVAFAAVLSSVSMKWVLPMLSENLFKRIGYSAMVLSGFMLMIQSSSNLLKANNGSLTTALKDEGLETKLKWQSANYALEFTYNEGFEFEQVIPYSQLTEAQKQFVESNRGTADKIVIEIVYSLNSTEYEAYYFKSNQLINKIDFK